MEIIESVQNNRIKEWTKLHSKKQRDSVGLFLIEQEHLIEVALKFNVVEQLLILKNYDHPFTQLEHIQVSQEVLDKLSQNVSKVQMIAVCRQSNHEFEVKDKMVFLDGIQDPGNMGTIIRTAISFGYEEIIISKDCVDIYNDKCVRSTQGALFQIPIIRTDLNEVLLRTKEKGITIIGTSLHKAIPLNEATCPNKVGLVFGNEGQGVTQEVLDLCDFNVKIEMNDFESLNVAVAAGICLYKFK